VAVFRFADIEQAGFRSLHLRIKAGKMGALPLSLAAGTLAWSVSLLVA